MKNIEIKEWTMKDPLSCMGFNAGVCWNAKLNDEASVARAIDCMKSGHGRVSELPDVYLVIEGFSAKALRELYTHIGGSPTRLQASTRYIDYEKGFDVVTPPSVEKNNDAAEVWYKAISDIKAAMGALKALGIPKEDYTNLLPLAYESKMIWKVNLRTLINFMNMRLCSRAYWEIREFSQMLKDALSNYSEQWYYICREFFVPKCEAVGYCTEAKCCGRKPKKE
ncbi:MAG: FAD-dependent thymidylate synthase [Bacteroidales bacterium]|nr:FAD-dependent thymidylate synthase [Bacteroidales bacterium]